MHSWGTVKFQALAAEEPASFAIGPFGSRITKENYVPVGVPVVRGVNLTRGAFVDEDFVYISDEKADELSSSNLAAGDLVFTHRGTIGQVSMIPRNPRFERYILSSSQVKARLNPEKAVPEFYYYWFRSAVGQRALLANASTVGVPGIASPLSTIRSIEVPHPPKPVQQGIAELLGVLDDKITVNKRTTNTAGQLAEAEYKRAISSLHETCNLGDLLDLKYGKSLPAALRRPGDVPVYGSGGIGGNHDQPLVAGPGVVVGRKGTVGAVYWSHGDFYPIDTTFYVEMRRPEIPLELAYFALKNLSLASMNSDSAVPGLNRSNALALTVAVPRIEVMGRFKQTVRPLFGLEQSLQRQSRALAELRDTLLPALMAGAIRVREAERAVEDAT